MGQARAGGKGGEGPDRQGESPGQRTAPHPLNRRRDGEDGHPLSLGRGGGGGHPHMLQEGPGLEEA